MFRSSPRDERGAYAVLFAILTVFLMGMAALAVDVGNAVAQRSDVQGQADFGALSGARELGAQRSGVVPPAVVAAVARSLRENMPKNERCDSCITESQLVDGGLLNGEVLFANGGLQVYAPKKRVEYGLARVLGFDSVDVQADATVMVGSRGGTLPMYASTGCDYGTQTLTDPANGLVTPVAPTNVLHPTQTNDATITAITSPNPAHVNVSNPAAPGPALTLSGSGFVDSGNGPNRKHVTLIGFFFEDGASLESVPVVASTRTDTFLEIPAIPAAVTSREGLWWIRVFKERVVNPDPLTGTWSATLGSKALRVGNAMLECDAGSSGGNFGTLRLARQDSTPSDFLAVNIADSLEEPLSLAIHPGDASGLCTDGVAGAIESVFANKELDPGTNCVATDPGLPAGAATAGFVTGLNTSSGHVNGRLNAGDHPTDTDCGRPNGAVVINANPYSINNDTLSCFLLPGKTLADISSPGYAGGTALADDVYESPRFFWLPVLRVEPSGGGSNTYSIYDFRPGFITDEKADGTAATAISPATGGNGLRIQNNNVIQVKVIFFNINALPSGTPGPLVDYLGVGPKEIRLID